MQRPRIELERDLTWPDLYRSWSVAKDHNPELAALADFQPIEWPARYYWRLDQPAQLVLAEDESIYLDWWPRRDIVQRTRYLRGDEPDWQSQFLQPSKASRYTLFFLWLAKEHKDAEEALAAVWISACLGMWSATLPPDWRGPLVDELEKARDAAFARMNSFGIDNWSRPCRHLLPESLAPLFRQPSDRYELIEMAVANTVYVLNRWTPVRLFPGFRPS